MEIVESLIAKYLSNKLYNKFLSLVEIAETLS